MKRILFLTQGDIQIPSSHYRVYQYLPALQKAGYEAVVHPAVTAEEFEKTRDLFSQKIYFQRIGRTFIRRMQDLHQLQDYDYVYVQKPILPAPFFNMELKIAREAKMIFDFDDAIFTKNPGEPFLAHWWPQFQRVVSICHHAYRVITANHNLAEFVQKNISEGPSPIVLPTAVNTEAFREAAWLAKPSHKIPVIGWIGSLATYADLGLVIPGLINLHSKTPFVARIIGDIQSAMPARFPIEWKPWNPKTEASDIAHLDYGLAPMRDSVWARGQTGLKILQYWAAGVPVVASPVGVYKEMIEDGENGLLASNSIEWTEKLLTLIKNPELRRKVIAGGHKTVEEKYSLSVLTPKFLSIFE